MTMPKDGGRLKRDVDADAMRAARVYLGGGVRQRDVARRFRIGWERIQKAVDRLRQETGYDRRPTMPEHVIAPQHAQIRCTTCPAGLSSWILAHVPLTHGWHMLEGRWFCMDCRGAAPWVVPLLRQREDDIAEAATTYEAMRAEIRRLSAENEALRCGDLHPFFDGRLSSARTSAFQDHLAGCSACQSGLDGLMQELTVASDWAPQRCTAAIACPRDDCGASRGERCKTDRPLHLERWDAWKAVGFR